MAQTLYVTHDYTLAAGANTLTLVHGLQDAQGNKLVPDFATIEFTSDPGATARWWVDTKSDTEVIIGLDTIIGTPTCTLKVKRNHSIYRSLTA